MTPTKHVFKPQKVPFSPLQLQVEQGVVKEPLFRFNTQTLTFGGLHCTRLTSGRYPRQQTRPVRSHPIHYFHRSEKKNGWKTPKTTLHSCDFLSLVCSCTLRVCPRTMGRAVSKKLKHSRFLPTRGGTHTCTTDEMTPTKGAHTQARHVNSKPGNVMRGEEATQDGQRHTLHLRSFSLIIQRFS